VFALLDDEHARRIIQMTDREPMAAREISSQLDTSRATVYRRLNRLVDAGLLTASIEINGNGHHRKRFQTATNRLSLSLSDEGFQIASTD
jgi:predicted transcriptional regulator